MGTPDFAVESLNYLFNEGLTIKAVVTVADKPAGRGQKLQPSPVKKFALEHNIRVLQPLNLSDPAFIEDLKQLQADLFVVVAFRKLPKVVWQMPPLGCFNLHASLLPQYRGAAPINHAVMNGESVTGVTTFFIDEKIDTGEIIRQESIEILPDETAGEVHDKLMVIGAKLVVETVNSIFRNDYTTKIQPIGQQETIKTAPKIFRDNCKINWEQSSENVHNHIRGLSPFPGAFSLLSMSDSEKEVKVLKSNKTGLKSDLRPGQIVVEKNRLSVMCKDELIELVTIQLPGKKAMSVEDFLRGNRAELYQFV